MGKEGSALVSSCHRVIVPCHRLFQPLQGDKFKSSHKSQVKSHTCFFLLCSIANSHSCLARAKVKSSGQVQLHLKFTRQAWFNRRGHSRLLCTAVTHRASRFASSARFGFTRVIPRNSRGKENFYRPDVISATGI